ncbi:MAG: pyrroline-5-carboxylate reductase [Treponema sp.]|nr:MAG: pyrroline-5-carboxylate reductase [Treponema sp.]
MKIGFLGFGNMGSALAKGLLSAGAVKSQNVYATARNLNKLQNRCKELNINPCKSVNELVEKSDWIVIAVKPHQIEEVIEPVKSKLQGKVIISVAVGMLFENYEKILPKNISHISFLPNTACEIGAGIIVVEQTHSLSESEFESVKKIFGSISAFETVPTKQFGIAGVIAGCGPAYAAMFIEALGDAGVRFGLSREQAYTLSAKMLEGTAMLKLNTKSHPAKMKDDVCSPAGTTIKGVLALEKHGFRNAVISAIDAALN